jgi:Tol biopolymer transport system component
MFRFIKIGEFKPGWFTAPKFLPDGKNFLFTWGGFSDKEQGLYLATLEHGRITRGPILLRKNQSAGHYSPSGGGRLLYLRDDVLYAQKLNVRLGTLEGEPERIVDGVFSSGPYAYFSTSRTGTLVWLSGRADLVQLTWFDRKGKVLSTAGPLADAYVAQLSPDEKHILVHTVGTGFSIVEENRNGRVALPGVEEPPLWMPDGSHILHYRKEGDSYRVLERALEGGADRELTRLPELSNLRDVSADGKVLLYQVKGNL